MVVVIFFEFFEGQGQRSTQQEWMVHVNSDDFSNNDDSLPLNNLIFQMFLP